MPPIENQNRRHYSSTDRYT